MKTIIRIDSSLRSEGSYSKNLGDFFIKEWEKKNPNSIIKHRDLSKNPIAHLDQETLDCTYSDTRQTSLLKLSDKLIDELFESDEILITVPMYNFGIPSALKAYFDLIVRVEKTFKYGNESIGLLTDKKAYIISAMGDKKTTKKSLVELHLQHILNYIGITEIYFFTIDTTSNEKLAIEKSKVKKSEIIKLLKK